MTILWTFLAVVTSYCLQGTRTASGTIPHFGTVATGPQFAFGTRLLIDGWPDVVWVVEDRGVPNGLIDIWLPSCRQSWQWGRRSVRVTILGPAAPTAEMAPGVDVPADDAAVEAEE